MSWVKSLNVGKAQEISLIYPVLFMLSLNNVNVIDVFHLLPVECELLEAFLSCSWDFWVSLDMSFFLTNSFITAGLLSYVSSEELAPWQNLLSPFYFSLAFICSCVLWGC